MLKLQKCLQNLCKTPDYIKCYLCLEKVKEKHWNSGNHRFQCMKKHKTRFESFLEHPNLCCTKCGRKLRLWTDQGTLFLCNSNLDTCKSDGSCRENSGGSRYSCFVCDFDLCLGCKNVWEARSQARRAGAARRLRRHPRLARAEVPVPSVVCLKTLCDTVAKIEEAKKLKRRVSVGVNTDQEAEVGSKVEQQQQQEQEERSESVTVENKADGGDTADTTDTTDTTDTVNLVTRVCTLAPLAASPGGVGVAAQCRAEVHLTNGGGLQHEAGAGATVLTNGGSAPVNGHSLSEEEEDPEHHQPRACDQLRAGLKSVAAERAQCSPCRASCRGALLSRLVRGSRAESSSLLSMAESPDIFHLRAPLVSMENLLTPALSDDSLLAEF